MKHVCFVIAIVFKPLNLLRTTSPTQNSRPLANPLEKKTILHIKKSKNSSYTNIHVFVHIKRIIIKIKLLLVICLIDGSTVRRQFSLRKGTFKYVCCIQNLAANKFASLVGAGLKAVCNR